MSQQPHHSTLLTRIEIYTEAEKYLLQAKALNLALWTAGDTDEQLKPACWLMADLLDNITTEVNNLWDVVNDKNDNPEHK